MLNLVSFCIFSAKSSSMIANPLLNEFLLMKSFNAIVFFKYPDFGRKPTILSLNSFCNFGNGLGILFPLYSTKFLPTQFLQLELTTINASSSATSFLSVATQVGDSPQSSSLCVLKLPGVSTSDVHTPSISRNNIGCL